MSSRENELRAVHNLALKRFEKPAPEVTNVDDDDDDDYGGIDSHNYAAQINLDVLKKQRLNDKSNYIKLGWIPATSCEAERLFSLCRRIFTEFRRARTPYTLEMLCYLRANRSLWDIKIVHEALSDDWLDEDELYNAINEEDIND
jgi:hypothetical protein